MLLFLTTLRMFFRRFNFNIFYINYYRLFYFIVLLYFMIVDLRLNFLTCSYLNSFFYSLDIRFFLLFVLELVLILFFIKFFFFRSNRNLINFILVDFYLISSFMFKNIGKYIYFFNNRYIFSFISNLVSFIRINILTRAYSFNLIVTFMSYIKPNFN